MSFLSKLNKWRLKCQASLTLTAPARRCPTTDRGANESARKARRPAKPVYWPAKSLFGQ